MASKEQEIVSAQVMLLSASGKAPDANLTAETIHQYAPSPEAAARARAAFAAAGFDVGPLVLNNFSITAPITTFERVFQTKLRWATRGAIQSIREDGSARIELPLEKLSSELSGHIAAITFTPPPDFGPTQFSY